MRPSHGVSLVPLFRTALLAFATTLCMFPQGVEAQTNRNVPPWSAVEWSNRLKPAQAPVIDGNLTDLISYVHELQANGGGCALEIVDPDSDVVLTQPFQPCSPIVPVAGGQYFVNGYDQNLGLVAFDGTNLYLGIRTVGQVGDPDGNLDPDTDCDTNIIDNPGIGQFESYKWFIDGNCDGNPEILVVLNNNTVTATGFSHGSTSFAFNGNGVEVLVQGVSLVPQFRARTFSGSDVDGLSEDLTQEVACPPLTPTLSISKSVEDVCAGQTTVVSITVQNTGPVPLDPVVITDQLPAGFSFAGNTTGIGAPTVTNGTATFPNIVLQPGETRAITFEIQSPGECSGSHSNSASVRGVFTHPCNPEEGHSREVVSQASAQFDCLQLQVVVEGGSACAGSTDELCAQVSGGAGPYTYSWTGPGGFTSSQQCITVGVDGSYTVTVTDSQGCTGTGTGQLTITPAPTCQIQGPNPVCAESDGHVYTASVNPSGGTVTYSWSVSGNGTVSGSSTGPSVTVNAGAAGSYTVNLSVTRNGCVGSCSLPVTVNAGPTCQITGPNPVCAQSQGNVYTASVNPSGGTVTYSWSVSGNGTISGSSTGTSVTVNAGGAGSYTVNLNVTRDGCTGTCSLPVTVNANPTCQITGPNPVCVESQGNVYTASVNPSGGTVTYSWSVSGNGTISGSSTGTSVTVNAGGAGSYTVNLNVFRDGCPGTCSLPVTVNSTTTCEITGPNPVCAESNGHVYTASVNPSGGTVSYGWSVSGNGTISGSSTGSSVTVNAGAAGSYTVNLNVMRNGCPGTCSLPVTVNASPTCQITGPNPVCAQSPGHVYSASVNPSGGTVTYSWSVSGNGTISGSSTGSSVTVNAGGTGSYTVNLTVTRNGCQGTCTLPVTVSPGLTVNVDDAQVCAGSTAQLCAEVTGGTAPYTYSWSGPGGFTSSQQCITVGVDGIYTVTVTDTPGCSGTGSGELNVLPALVVNVGDKVTCEGVPVQLCAVLPTPRPEPVTYTWTGPGGFHGTGPCINVSTPGVYTVVVTDGEGCTGTDSATITVETPDVDIIKTAVPTHTEDNSQVTIVVANTGASALSPVRVTDLLPPGLSINTGSLQSNCGVTATTQSTGSGTHVTFSTFHLNPGQTCTITYTMDCLELDGGARIDTAKVIAWCEGVNSEDPGNADLAVSDSDTALVVCQSPFFACPHTIGFWRQQCAQKPNGSTKVCLEGMYDLWADVLNATGVVNWAQPNQSTSSILAMSDADRFEALCTQLQGPRPMTQRDMAEVQYLGLMLNVAAGALPLDVPLSGTGGFSGTAAEAIAGIENAINNGQNVSYWAGVADAINNGVGIQAESCGDDVFRNQPACTGGDEDGADAKNNREVWLTLYPNPVFFEDQTMVKYGVPETLQDQAVHIQIFDINGRLVRTLPGSNGSAGEHASAWDLRDDTGNSVRSGIYFYRLTIGLVHKVERLMVIR